MKAIFFSILIFNTAFFLWEYRIGAPEIYLPQEESEILGANTQQIILLPEEISDLGIEIAEEGDIHWYLMLRIQLTLSYPPSNTA
jgi:hypothetical protein